jgi:hypothetical protein
MNNASKGRCVTVTPQGKSEDGFRIFDCGRTIRKLHFARITMGFVLPNKFFLLRRYRICSIGRRFHAGNYRYPRPNSARQVARFVPRPFRNVAGATVG